MEFFILEEEDVGADERCFTKVETSITSDVQLDMCVSEPRHDIRAG